MFSYLLYASKNIINVVFRKRLELLRINRQILSLVRLPIPPPEHYGGASRIWTHAAYLYALSVFKTDLLNRLSIAPIWCERRDLNPYGINYLRILSPVRLPIPPLSQIGGESLYLGQCIGCDFAIIYSLILQRLTYSYDYKLKLPDLSIYGADNGIRTRNNCLEGSDVTITLYLLYE